MGELRKQEGNPPFFTIYKSSINFNKKDLGGFAPNTPTRDLSLDPFTLAVRQEEQLCCPSAREVFWFIEPINGLSRHILDQKTVCDIPCSIDRQSTSQQNEVLLQIKRGFSCIKDLSTELRSGAK